MTPEPTSDKEVETKEVETEEVETKEVETEEVETEETNIPTSKYFTEGNKSTGLQVEVCSTYNIQLYCMCVCISMLINTFTMYNCTTHTRIHTVKLSCLLVHVTYIYT